MKFPTKKAIVSAFLTVLLASVIAGATVSPAQALASQQGTTEGQHHRCAGQIAGPVHSAQFCAVAWNRDEIKLTRAYVKKVRAEKLLRPLKMRPVGYSLPKLRKSLRWHKDLLRQARRAPSPTLFQQATHYAIDILHYPAKEWNCLAQIPGHEGGWSDPSVQFAHRHLSRTEALRRPLGIWQANPGKKMSRWGDPFKIRTQIRWVISYATNRYHGGCAAWEWRRAHHYW